MQEVINQLSLQLVGSISSCQIARACLHRSMHMPSHSQAAAEHLSVVDSDHDAALVVIHRCLARQEVRCRAGQRCDAGGRFLREQVSNTLSIAADL